MVLNYPFRDLIREIPTPTASCRLSSNETTEVNLFYGDNRSTIGKKDKDISVSIVNCADWTKLVTNIQIAKHSVRLPSTPTTSVPLCLQIRLGSRQSMGFIEDIRDTARDLRGLGRMEIDEKTSGVYRQTGWTPGIYHQIKREFKFSVLDPQSVQDGKARLFQRLKAIAAAKKKGQLIETLAIGTQALTHCEYLYHFYHKESVNLIIPAQADLSLRQSTNSFKVDSNFISYLGKQQKRLLLLIVELEWLFPANGVMYWKNYGGRVHRQYPLAKQTDKALFDLYIALGFYRICRDGQQNLKIGIRFIIGRLGKDCDALCTIIDRARRNGFTRYGYGQVGIPFDIIDNIFAACADWKLKTNVSILSAERRAKLSREVWKEYSLPSTIADLTYVG
ncbi:hypothetical protein MMC25_002669 [Agyrium rufum]|nr:hypothetical protein [Agyrium rufum]